MVFCVLLLLLPNIWFSIFSVYCVIDHCFSVCPLFCSLYCLSASDITSLVLILFTQLRCAVLTGNIHAIVHGFVSLVVNTSRSFPRSWLIIKFVTRLTRRVSVTRSRNCLPFRSTWVHPRFLVGFLLLDL